MAEPQQQQDWFTANAPPPPAAPPATPVANGPRMGAAIPGTAIGDQPPALTLGEILADPKAGLLKAAQLVGRDLSDPKFLASLVASWAIPKMLGQAPAIRAAASRVEVNPGAVLDLKLNQPLQFLKKAITVAPKPAAPAPTPEATIPGFDRYAPNVSGAPAASAPMAAPPESAVGGTAPPAGPPAAAAPVSAPPPVTPAAAGSKAMLSAPEVLEFEKLRAAGKTEAQAWNAIRAAREIREKFGLTIPTKAETQFPKGWRGKTTPPSE